jgi:hypothetical protein
MDRVMALSLKDRKIQRTLPEVYYMLQPPTAQFAPAIAAKVLREAVMQKLGVLSRLGKRCDPKEVREPDLTAGHWPGYRSPYVVNSEREKKE